MNFFTRTALRIVLWCVLAIAFSHVTDALVAINYFGDELVEKTHWRGVAVIEHEQEWGVRHYWWNTMCVGLLLTAVAMLFRQRIHAFGRSLRGETPDRFKRAQPALTVLAGATLGLLVTLTSVGAGALGTVMLLYLYPLRMTPSRLVGTDIVHAIPLTLLAGAGHLAMGNVDFRLLGFLLLGSVPGVLVGSLVGTKVPQVLLRGAISTVLVAVASKLLLS